MTAKPGVDQLSNQGAAPLQEASPLGGPCWVGGKSTVRRECQILWRKEETPTLLPSLGERLGSSPCSPRERIPGVRWKVAQAGIFELKSIFKGNNVGEINRHQSTFGKECSRKGADRGREGEPTSLPKGSVLSSVKWEHCLLHGVCCDNWKASFPRKPPYKAGPPKHQRSEGTAQLTLPITVKIGAQGSLSLKSVLSTPNCFTPTLLSLSLTVSHMVFSDNAVTSTQRCSEFPTDPK